MAWVANWEGGRVWQTKDGRTIYYIRRMRNGIGYNISTKATSLKAAYAHLTRFDIDPVKYAQEMAERAPGALKLSQMMVDRFLANLVKRGVGEGHIAKNKGYMKWWMERLTGDLRRYSTRDLEAILSSAPEIGGRTAVIKGFWSWGIKEEGFPPEPNNPTTNLVIPRSVPEQNVRSKVIAKERHLRVVEAIAQPWKDLLIVLGGTGWHISELRRFIKSGTIEYPPDPRNPEQNLYVLVTRHKGGQIHKTVVSEKVEAAAVAAKERGDFIPTTFTAAVHACCRMLDPKLRPFSPGEYRHSVATWAVEKGASLEAVSAFLGHRSPSTTKKFYAVHSVVPKVPTLE